MMLLRHRDAGNYIEFGSSKLGVFHAMAQDYFLRVWLVDQTNMLAWRSLGRGLFVEQR